MRVFEELALTGKLPSPPAVGVTILELTQSEDFTIAEVARAIQADPALTGRILKLANSCLMGGVVPVATVNEAVKRIGIDTLRSVSLGFSLISTYREGACSAFDFSRFWSESLATALGAQALAKLWKLADPAESYVCGLLFKIGKLGLACVHPQGYESVLRSSQECDLWAAEDAAFAVNHGALGEAMLLDWGLPNYLAKVLSLRPDDLDVQEVEQSTANIVKLMAVAERLGKFCFRGQEYEGSLEDLRDLSGLEDEEFESYCNHVAAEWREWGQILNLDTRDVPEVQLSQDLRGHAHPALKKSSAADANKSKVGDSCRILIVDEDTLSVQILSKSIADERHEITVCREGSQALALILESLPDVVVCNAELTGTSGQQLVRTLRGCPEGQQIYFVMLCSERSPAVELQAYDSGVDDFILKPCNPDLVRAHIHAASRLVGMKREIQRSRRQLESQVAEMAVLNRRLLKASLTDPLTDLPNRRSAIENLKTQWSLAKRKDDVRIALLMIDIDHFKMVNDQYGHDVGDEVLRQVAEVFKRHARTGEQVSRIGGEEFLVSAVMSLEEAQACGERLRQAVENHRIEIGAFNQNVTVSVGVTHANPSIEGYEAVMKSADEALYMAKKSGRNRVHVVRQGSLV